MGAVVANAGPSEPRRPARGLESRRDVRADGYGVGRLQHEDRAAARVSSRNDHAVPRWQGETLVDATVLRVPASNCMKPDCTAGRKIEGSRPKCDGHFARPPTPGSFSPRGLVFLESGPRVFVEENQCLAASD